MEETQFLQILSNLVEKSKAQENKLYYDEINDAFRDQDLDEEKMDEVYDSLASKDIEIVDITDQDQEDDDAFIAEEEGEVEALEAVDGVTEAVANKDTKTAVVTLSKDVSFETLKAAVVAQDYEVLGEA